MSRATASTHCPMKEAVGCWLSPPGAHPGDPPVAELSPGEVAVQVRPEQHPLLEDLLVQAGAVEPGLEREADVGGDRRVRGGGHERLFPVPLIQDQALEDL